MEKSNLNTERKQWNQEPNLDEQPLLINTNIEHRIAIPNFESPDFLQELDEKVKSMMEQGQNISSNPTAKTKICKMCGKEGQNVAIRDHIEANHLEVPCNACEKTFRSRIRLRQHACTGK